MRDLDPEVTATLIANVADIALVIDEHGVIEDVSVGGSGGTNLGLSGFLGRRWIDTVTVESRTKIEELLAAREDSRRWRQVNHPQPEGPDVPVLYSVVPMGQGGRVMAVGRDLSALATLQQELLSIQQSMERDYARFRQAEARYRLLFQIASEAILVVDADSGRVVEANPAAGRLLESTPARLVGRPFPLGFDEESMEAARDYLTTLRATGYAKELTVRGRDGEEFELSATMLRQGGESLFLVHLLPLRPAVDDRMPALANARLVQIIESSPDGFVITSPEGEILAANSAFLEMCQLGAEQQVIGQPLDRWLGRPGVDLALLLKTLRASEGSVRMFRSIVRGELGSRMDVELSAVAALDGDQPCFGFTIRNVAARREPSGETPLPVPQSVNQLTELVGQVSLKELVRETTDVIERLCIEAALELTGDNRASAAEMLGLSRQSLYVKLRRYGLGDLDSGSDA